MSVSLIRVYRIIYWDFSYIDYIILNWFYGCLYLHTLMVFTRFRCEKSSRDFLIGARKSEPQQRRRVRNIEGNKEIKNKKTHQS
jgi:hypothetical protein